MNMCMIMTMNIYITPQNKEMLRKWAEASEERTMSGLVNSLLHMMFVDLDKRSVSFHLNGKHETKVTFESLHGRKPLETEPEDDLFNNEDVKNVEDW